MAKSEFDWKLLTGYSVSRFEEEFKLEGPSLEIGQSKCFPGSRHQAYFVVVGSQFEDNERAPESRYFLKAQILGFKIF